MSNWLAQVTLATIVIVPAWLAIGFFSKNYQVKPEVFMVWYFIGIVITTVIFSTMSAREILPSAKVTTSIIIVGLTIGALANILIFNSVVNAPNPGLPIAIANSVSIFVFIASALLAIWLPRYFDAVKFDVWSLVGIILTLVGVAIITVRR